MPDLELRRYETYLFQPKSSTDDAQVPLEGATLAVTRQGASVRTESALIYEQETAELEVQDCGLIVVGDNLMRDFDDTVDLSVLSIASDRRSMMVQNVGGGAVQLAVGERLRPTTGHPSLYKDPRAKQALATPTVDSLGYVWFFTPAATVDFVVSGAGLASPRMYIDKPAGWRRGGETWRNVNDYPSIQAAIDSLPIEGGTVFIPAGTYTLTETLYTPCDRPCHIVGEGAQMNSGPSTVLRWTVNTGMVRFRGDHSSLRSLSLRMDASGTAESEDQGYGVFVGRRDIEDAHPHPGTSASETEHEKYNRQPLKGFLLEDIHILYSPGWGLTIPGYGETSSLMENPDPPGPPVPQPEPGRVIPASAPGEGGTLSFWGDIRRVRVTQSRKYGALFTGGGCTTLFFDNCAFLWMGVDQAQETSYYAYLRKTVGAIFRNTTFEGSSPPAPSGEGSPPFNPWIRIIGCQSTTFDTCWFENDPQPGVPDPNVDPYLPQYFIHLAGDVLAARNMATHLVRLHLVRGGNNHGGMLRLVYCDAGASQGLCIDSPLVIATTPVESGGQMIDSAPVVLNGESNTDANEAIVVTGSGLVQDDQGQLWPLLFTTIPSNSIVGSSEALKLPVTAVSRLTSGSNAAPNLPMLEQSGTLAIVDLDLGGASPNAAALMSFWGGRNPGWRLANNCPVITTAERNARSEWADGDMIVNSTHERLEIRFGGVWIIVKNLP